MVVQDEERVVVHIAVDRHPGLLTERICILTVGIRLLAEQQLIVGAQSLYSLSQHPLRCLPLTEPVDGIDHILLLQLQQVQVLQVLDAVELVEMDGRPSDSVTAPEVVSALHLGFRLLGLGLLVVES